MNIKELKDKIKDLPDNMDVMIEQADGEFFITTIEYANVQAVRFGSPEIPKSEWPVVDCLVLKDY